MLIKCYGARGSIAVSGPEYTKYGGDTTCLTVSSSKGDLVVIDAGTGIRRLGNELLNSNITDFSMIFTHAHWDHLLGFPFFKPLYLSRFNINVHGCPFVPNKTVKDIVAGAMTAPNFPVDMSVFQAGVNYNSFMYSSIQIGSLTVIPIFLSHPNGGVGYKFIENEKSFVFLTDNELGHRHRDGLDYIDYVRDCKGVDLLIHDTEYTDEEYANRKMWGHSSVGDVIRLAIEAEVKKLGLYHHNQDRSDEQVDSILNDCITRLSNSGKNIECFAAYQGMEITL